MTFIVVGIIVGARQAGSNISETADLQNGGKKKKSLSSSSVDGNNQKELAGEWPDWFEQTGSGYGNFTFFKHVEQKKKNLKIHNYVKP